MTESEKMALVGDRIRRLRLGRGLNQEELAALMDRSVSWVSQVERGVRAVERPPVLQKLAELFDVDVAYLRGEDVEAVRPRQAYLLRTALTGHPALSVALGVFNGEAESDLATLEVDAERVWPLLHTAQYEDLEPLLADLIHRAEAIVRLLNDAARPACYALLSRVYQAAAAMLARLHESEAAWVAADRAFHAAERQGDPLAIVASLYRMVHALLGLQDIAAAQHVAETAISSLQARVDRRTATPPELSLFGALNLAMAVISGREGQRSQAHAFLDAAADAATQLGADRNEYGTEFGPTNLAIHRVSVAVDLGDAGQAIELASGIDSSSLSPERQFRLAIDTARAEIQRGNLNSAIQWLAQAEMIAPESFENHPLPRLAVQELLQRSGRRSSRTLKEMAQRVGLLP
ncbi:helix-turn-helix domain-containing protein [Nonomuraea sp. NPDC050536]|uniref:helix-turn-helix domain-containing protein n=1 Tax=Nonomuraea sp. NPDC050536 TaxID=3364366 RepID=UPI0037CAEDBB